MAILDSSALTSILKIKYTQKTVHILSYRKNPGWASIRKKTDFGGKNKQVAIGYALTAGASSQFAYAQANVSPSKYTAWNVTRSNYYGYGSIAGDMVVAAKGQENSLLEALDKEVKGAIQKCTRRLAWFLYGNGGGSVGQISAGSTVASPTITLANISAITNFEVGDKLQASGDDGTGGGGLRSAGAVAVITALDRDLGTITISGNWTASIALVQPSDFLFIQGDYNNVAPGYLGWLPTTAPGVSDSFYGVNRSVDATRLAGIRFANTTGAPIEETFIDCMSRMQREGAEPTVAYGNPVDWAKHVKSQTGKVTYNRVQPIKNLPIGFRGVTITGPTGDVEFIADLNCPAGTAVILQDDVWAFESAGPAPRILDFDGLMIQRDPTSDSYSLRVGTYGAPTCEAPGLNANVQL